MAVARAGTLGATRVCPHCKAVVLQSESVCPGCRHHLKFNSGKGAEPELERVSTMRLEGSIRHAERDESCEYCVVVSITNDRGEKITRQVVGVGALLPGERHKYSISVDLLPVRGPGAAKRSN